MNKIKINKIRELFYLFSSLITHLLYISVIFLLRQMFFNVKSAIWTIIMLSEPKLIIIIIFFELPRDNAFFMKYMHARKHPNNLF